MPNQLNAPYMRVGSPRETKGEYDLVVDGEVHHRHYFGPDPDEPEEYGMTLLGADGDDSVSMEYCMLAATVCAEWEEENA